jgi:pimeloyl-ACP methyl ester carboxylesterase
MDSRGQGRSTMSSTGIQKIHLIGWSDGAIIGLNIAMNYPNRLS